MDDAAKRLIYERNGVTPPRATGRTGFSGSFGGEDARRIIAERNGLGSGFGRTPALSPDDAQLLARMQTNRQARAVLGAVAGMLQTAYAQQLPTLARVSSAGRDLQAAMKSRLDGVNNYAQKVYAGLPNDDAPVSPANQKKIALTVAQARDAAKDIDDAVASQHLDIGQGLVDVLRFLIAKALGAVGGALTPGGFPLWAKIAIGGVVVLVAVGVLTKIVGRVAFGQTALAEAEDAAVAIAESRRRKARSRRVLSIS